MATTSITQAAGPSHLTSPISVAEVTMEKANVERAAAAADAQDVVEFVGKVNVERIAESYLPPNLAPWHIGTSAPSPLQGFPELQLKIPLELPFKVFQSSTKFSLSSTRFSKLLLKVPSPSDPW